MTEWRSDPDEEPDPEIRAEAIFAGVFVVLAYLYGAYLVVTQLFVN